MEYSKIEWCDHTFNPWIGCTKVSVGCKNCYAETLMDKRYGRVKWGLNGTRSKTSKDYWKKPLRWNRQEWFECTHCDWRGSDKDVLENCPSCSGHGMVPARARVFCASLADVFEDEPRLYEWQEELFSLIDQTDNLDWLLLTKRPERANPLIEDLSAGLVNMSDLDNVWLGVSIENQEQAEKRISELLKIQAGVRFLSCEPLLSPIDFQGSLSLIDWVIVGGESGLDARPMHPDWVRSIRDQCQEAGVPFLFKQWGAYGPAFLTEDYYRHPAELVLYDPGSAERFGDFGYQVYRYGKGRSGRVLDGREWNEFPQRRGDG